MLNKKIPSKSCKICRSNDIKFHFSVNNQNLWKCKICDFIQVEKEPSSLDLETIYSDTYFRSVKYNDKNLAMVKENQRRHNLLRKWTTKGAEILDVGCSTGDFIKHVKSEYQMYGNDFSDFAVQKAIQKNPDLANKFKSGRIEDTEWSEHLFDMICIWDVIEHIWDPFTVIKDLFSRIKPGGCLVISTPAIDSFNAKILGRYWPFMTPPEHLSFLSLKSFRNIALNLDNCEFVHYSRKGKWANLSFIAYKITRIAPAWFPSGILFPFFKWPLKLISLYVPTRDIASVVLRKNK